MSEGRALVRFHDWRAARDRKAATGRLWRSRYHRAGGGAYLGWACRAGARGRHLIVLQPAAHGGAEVQHRFLTYRIIKEIRNAARELARFSAPFFSVLPDLFVVGDDTREIHSLAPGVATSHRPVTKTGRRLAAASRHRPPQPRRMRRPKERLRPHCRARDIG